MIREDLLTPNESSRPQLKIRMVQAIVLHWYGNPGTTADATRGYFESLKTQQPKPGKRAVRASSQYIIDNREIIRCIPENEVAYHCGEASVEYYSDYTKARWPGEHPNWYTLGLEHAHPGWNGVWDKDTVRWSLLLCAGLCLQYGLDPMKDILRHYDITGKICPRHFVEFPMAFEVFKTSVGQTMEV